MTKLQILKLILDHQVVAVVRGDTREEAEMIAKGASNGGVKILEITYTVPDASGLIEKLKTSEPNALIGAGTVLDGWTASEAIHAGASFIVSPMFSQETAIVCHRHQVPYLPGCYTVKEIMEALEFGIDIIKVFPGNLIGPKGLKTLKGPLPHVQMMPSGGVDAKNINEWITSGAVAVSIGSSLYRDSEEEVKQAASEIVKTLTRKASR